MLSLLDVKKVLPPFLISNKPLKQNDGNYLKFSAKNLSDFIQIFFDNLKHLNEEKQKKLLKENRKKEMWHQRFFGLSKKHLPLQKNPKQKKWNLSKKIKQTLQSIYKNVILFPRGNFGTKRFKEGIKNLNKRS